MKEQIIILENELKRGATFLLSCSTAELNLKPSPSKWSKKEILGHLIDSAINNLQRFTEIQFKDKPYKIKKYNQDALVIANNYFNSDINELINFWKGLNQRIIFLMKNQTEETLNYQIEISPAESGNLKFLMTDYVDHISHHLNQIELNIKS